ncbi:transcriptional activator of glycolytic enzymes-domain-containing protein [Xylaria bambusicola]|uniref:transcriptional activator of glycolytic enzymes-domain-containing protein n=1 Tax=Xylaria bambusicola TaxID=326684 RepID=UPI002008A563|nr:transcriptional activator of glycolytic enzymes-domain-containing protein [Xylaria bambusicola]KAI0503436.1 transcriptional activator of glycolytic enzymes-domain-containing protein [Xylaria bambusicola]
MPSQVTGNSSSSIAPPSTVVASTTAPIPVATTTPAPTHTTTTTTIPTIPTSSATITPGPAAPTGAIALKRPAASDLQRIAGTSATPSKRQATGSGSHSLRSIPNPTSAAGASVSASASTDPSRFESPALLSHHTQLLFQPASATVTATMPAPALLTEDQLHDRTPEQLIATILQLQSQHQHFLAQINAQFESINQQLTDLRSGLVASHQAAASALSARDQPVRSIIPPPPAPPQQTAVPPPPRPPTQTPTRATPRVPPPSPGHHIAPRSSVSGSTPTPAGPPQYEYRTVATVEEVWKEYREGMGGQPAIEKLDSMYGSRWRPEPRGRTWYSRRKVIWDKIREYINEGMDEDAAVQEVEKLREGGTINKLIRMLQDERKEKGIGDDGVGT